MPNLSRIFLLLLGSEALPLHSQVVPVQANIDAQAQRRLQADAQESIRRRRIDENLRRLGTALDASNLTSTNGPAITRQSMAALADLQKDNVIPKDALQQALKKSSLDSSTTQKTSTYLLECWGLASERITPDDLQSLRKGEEPKTPLNLPPYQP